MFDRYAASFYKNWIIAKRNFFTVFEVIFWPFISLMSIGLMTGFLSMEQDKVSFILIGAIAFSIVQVCQIDIAYVMLFDVWSKYGSGTANVLLGFGLAVFQKVIFTLVVN